MDKTACFFVKTDNREILERNEFYAQDIQILGELGYEVHVATKIKEIYPADLYFVWWWTWAFAPVLFSRLLGRPSVITGTFNIWNFEQRNYLHRKLHEFSLRLANANVFVSQLEYRKTQEILFVNNPHYSPHIVDTDVYHPPSTEREDMIFTVAWMHTPNAKRKCLPEIVQAAAEVHKLLPNVRFVIAGEHASYYPKLVEMVKELDANHYIHFPGAISKEEKIEYMQRCKLYLQPSRYEGFGLAILEAMSCGAPVVTSPVGAVPEVVGSSAVFVNGDRPMEIAAAVLDLLQRNLYRQQIGSQSRDRAETMFPYARRKQELKLIISQITGDLTNTSSREGA